FQEASMPEISPYPQLRPGVKLKKNDANILIYDFRMALHDLIHPSHAFVLSLCTGAYSCDQIKFLVKETYQLTQEEAAEFVDSILLKNQRFLSKLPGVSNNHASLDPSQFLFKTDESERSPALGEKLKTPLGINLSVSMQCNFRCKYCYQLTTANHSEALDYNRTLEIIDEAAAWGVVYVGITGGEPTIYPGWINLIKKVTENGMTPIFTTNGKVIGMQPELAGKLSEFGLEEITVSLDSHIPDIHHSMTQTTNTFAHVVKGIRTLAASGIRTSVKCVLTPDNINSIEGFLDFVVALGVKEIGITSMQMGAPGSNANSVDGIQPDEFHKVVDIVSHKKSQYADICDIHPPRDSSCQWSQEGWYPCGGLFTGMSIFPSGYVSVCDKLGTVEEFIYGNVYEAGLQEIWEGERFQQLRSRAVDPEFIDADCTRCEKLPICRTSCFVDSFIKSGNYYAKHPNCSGPFA
ncbi:MAG TPA: radical SAM protein, partial [Longilinea sp.]|nr:radical SAM protein [Longilinea sp.]